MNPEKREKQVVFFLGRYRLIWLVLFLGAIIWTPFATLGFVGLLKWLDATAALCSWLGFIVLGATLFVSGRWVAGYSNGRVPLSSDDVSY